MAKLILITGDGRGKTSAAISHIYLEQQKGKKIVVVQFLKTGRNCGECKYFSVFNQIQWFCLGKEEFYRSDSQFEEFRIIMNEGIKRLEAILAESKIDILLLDELGLVLSYNLLDWKELTNIIRKAEDTVIITGRKISEKIKNQADVIINIKKIKHPYDQGIVAREGIDY